MGIKIEPGITQCVITGGLWNTIIAAEGMRQLSFGNNQLIRRGPRLNLGETQQSDLTSTNQEISKGFNRIHIQPDIFNSNGQQVETHALGIAPGVDNEELEFFQYFKPVNDNHLEYKIIWVIPPEFADLPRLGIKMELPGNFTISESSPTSVFFRNENGIYWQISTPGKMIVNSQLFSAENYLEVTIDFPKEPNFTGRFIQTLDFILP